MARAAKLIADAHHLNMWRVKYPDGTVSDMLNRTRAHALMRDARRLKPAVGLPPWESGGELLPDDDEGESWQWDPVN
jgi:hypothetical protein